MRALLFCEVSFSLLIKKLVVEGFHNPSEKYATKNEANEMEIHIKFNHPGLKGLGHAILGNFSTDRMVVELTKISK